MLLDHAVEIFGSDRILLGSDWPFAMGVDVPRTLVEHRRGAFLPRAAVVNAGAVLFG